MTRKERRELFADMRRHGVEEFSTGDVKIRLRLDLSPPSARVVATTVAEEPEEGLTGHPSAHLQRFYRERREKAAAAEPRRRPS